MDTERNPGYRMIRARAAMKGAGDPDAVARVVFAEFATAKVTETHEQVDARIAELIGAPA